MTNLRDLGMTNLRDLKDLTRTTTNPNVNTKSTFFRPLIRPYSHWFWGGLLLLLLYSRTGPRRALSLKLSDTRVYEPEKRTRLGRNRELCTVKHEVIVGAATKPRDWTK